MLVGSQLTVDGKPATPPPPPRAPVIQAPDPLRAPGNGSVFVGSKGYMATTSRGEGGGCRRASAGPITGSSTTPAARRESSAGLDSRLQRRRAPGVSSSGVASKYIEWLALGPIALRVGGKLMWDSKNMRFTNSEEANKLLRPYTRKGWESEGMTKLTTWCASCWAPLHYGPQAPPIRVMILDGESGGPYHAWQQTTPYLKRMLNDAGIFQVDVVTAPPKGGDFSVTQARLERLSGGGVELRHRT